MIFAELEYTEDYWDFHVKLYEYLFDHFQHLKSGIQGDSWFCIYDGEEKVAIDTFSSHKHQVKASAATPLLKSVIKTLQLRYKVNIYPQPEFESHEDE